MPMYPRMRTVLSLVVFLLLVLTACATESDHVAYPSQPPTPDWASNATIYEVNIRQFSEQGTFAAVAEHLPRLREMGVDILWLMPIHPIGEENRKGSLGSYYAVQDYKAINPEFGTEDDFRDLVRQIHEHGMYVILDWVPNHTAWDAEWTRTHPEVYVTDEDGGFIIPPETDWTDVIQLDFDNPETHRLMHDALAYWVREFDIDGYRCDVAERVPTAFWNEARRRLEAIRPVFMLAEAEVPEHHDYAFDMSYGWETHHYMNRLAAGEITVSEFDEHLKDNAARFPAHAYRMQFTSNHDENSWIGTVFERYGDGALTFAVLAATIPGMPLVYNGQEAALDRRLEFFEKDPIDWRDFPLQDFYTRLLQLNRSNQALFNGLAGGGLVRLETTADDQVFAFYREKGGDRVIVVLNFGDQPASFEVSFEYLAGRYADLFDEQAVELKARETLSLAPWGYAVYHAADDS